MLLLLLLLLGVMLLLRIVLWLLNDRCGLGDYSRCSRILSSKLFGLFFCSLCSSLRLGLLCFL